MNRKEIEELVYSIREIYERSNFTSVEFSAIIKECGFSARELSLIVKRSLMWGYIIKCSCQSTPSYEIVDIDKAVRTRTLHHGRHGKTQTRKSGQNMVQK